MTIRHQEDLKMNKSLIGNEFKWISKVIWKIWIWE